MGEILLLFNSTGVAVSENINAEANCKKNTYKVLV